MGRRNFESKEQFGAYYEEVAKHYDHERSSDFEGRQVDRLQREFVLRNLAVRRGQKVIECGCGTGRILLALARKGVSCSGIDTSKNMLTLLKKKARKEKLDISVKQGDIEHIPFGDNIFDGVFSIHVLMHMQNIRTAVAEMYRIAKPGARIVFDLPSRDSPWTKLSMLLDPQKKRTLLYTRKQLMKELEGYDYRLTGIFSYARTFYKIPVLRHLVAFLERFVPLPLYFRAAYMVVITK